MNEFAKVEVEKEKKKLTMDDGKKAYLMQRAD
jgi:hypothetical protein